MNVLIVGLGSVGKKHVTAIKNIDPLAGIIALRSSECGEDMEGVRNIFALNELDAKVDFAIVSNPTALHEPTIRELTVLNCPLFIEKPVMANLAYADELIDLIRQKNIKTYVACNMRFHPAIRFIADYLLKEKPVVNEVNIYCGSYLPEWRPGRDFRTLYSAQKGLGGGVHLDLIHELDYCTWLFGMPGAVLSNKTSASSLSIDAVDRAHFELRYSSFTASVTLNYFRRDAKRTVEIVTADGTIEADLLANTIVQRPSGDILYQAPFEMSDTYSRQMAYFMHQITGKKPLMNDIDEGIQVLKLALHE